MFVNCTFSFVDPHVNENLGNQEDPALFISGVLKPKVDGDKTKLLKFCI